MSLNIKLLLLYMFELIAAAKNREVLQEDGEYNVIILIPYSLLQERINNSDYHSTWILKTDVRVTSIREATHKIRIIGGMLTYIAQFGYSYPIYLKIRYS